MFPLCTLNFRLSVAVAVGELFLSNLGILLSVPVYVVILPKVNLTSLVRVFNGSFRLPPLILLGSLVCFLVLLTLNFRVPEFSKWFLICDLASTTFIVIINFVMSRKVIGALQCQQCLALLI